MRNFYWSQPALNYGFEYPDPAFPWQLPTDHPDVLAVREEMKKVVRFWMDLGADGFRADMAGALVKYTRFRGDSQSDANRLSGTQTFWREVREILDLEYPGSFMAAEWSHPKSAVEGGFHADFYHWFSGFNDLFQKESWRILNRLSEGHSFFDAEGKGNIVDFLDGYMQQYEAVKARALSVFPWNHDIARISIGRSVRELEMIFAFSITLPGILYILWKRDRNEAALWPAPCGSAYGPRAAHADAVENGPNADFDGARRQSVPSCRFV